MIRELTIKNYRGFKDFKMDSLDRINLIAGANNVGKTSLLEALYLNLAPTLPDWPTPIKLLRGFENLNHKLRIEDMWGWLFYKRDFQADIQIIVVIENKKKRFLEIKYIPTHRIIRFFIQQEEQGAVTALEISGDSFSRNDSPQARFNGKPVNVGVVLENRNRSIEEEAKLFSKIDDAGRKDVLIKPLRFLDNRLHDLAVSVASGIPMINCDIGLGQRIPLIQMGEGMVHFFSVISEIVNSANGVVLIDEIDNGLHYSVMVDVWKAIAEAAHNSNTQIFATTHSFECISAAHKAFSENGRYDFRLHRLDRINDEIKAITYDKEMLEAALVTDLEVR